MNRNPHFDDNLVIWDDAYSGTYQPVKYDAQFDDQWRLYLEQATGFHSHTGVETTDPYINDRIADLTGVESFLCNSGPDLRRNIGGRLFLEPKFPIDFFKGKRCLDIGCGAGRWTRTLMTLGATVKSVDVSAHALESTRRFNDDVEYLNLFDIIDGRPDLHAAFDFVLCWGVVMCTHDPKQAFRNVAATVKPGGHLYAMVYAPTYHASAFVTENRKKFHQLQGGFADKLQFAYSISDTPENAINVFDMLNPFYNWCIPEEVIHGWMRDNGFEEVVTLNKGERDYCAFHVLGKKK